MQDIRKTPSYRITAARGCAVLALCMVPISTAVTNIACALFVLVLLSAPEFWRNLPSVLRHRSALSALLLFGALLVGVGYTVAPHSEAWSWLGKYVKLLILPFAVVAFEDADANWQAIVRRSLFVTLAVVAVLSTTNYIGLTALGPAHNPLEPDTRAWVFKNRISGGMLSALLFYQAADLALAARSSRWRLVLAAVAALAFVNVLVMLQGRTAQIVALIFLLVVAARLSFINRSQLRLHPVLCGAGLIAVAGLTLAVACSVPSGRLLQVASEVREYRQTDAVTSSGLRLEWYRKSLELIKQRPVFGYGTAGLGTEFKKLTAGKTGAEGLPTHNPHNEYLLLGVQLGGLGIALFINLLVQIARDAMALERRSRHLLLAWLAAFALGCLANSMLLDFTEGHMLVLLAGILLGCGYRRSAATSGEHLNSQAGIAAPRIA
ncbi:O-antigen ligase family protein [Paraburkholderia sp. SOS3]|uniref:O-antigen ligase family protein n=1 Tax=Paraburkholderia sp. SOS3 TaxID=1926494 RepID=UPI003FA79059